MKITRTYSNWFDLMKRLKVGEYYAGGVISSVSAAAPGANNLTAHPFVCVRPITVDRIAMEVTTLEDPGNIRLGIFKDNGSLYPGALLLDAGTVSTATTGVKAITINQALQRGIYWLAANFQGNTMGVRRAAFGGYPLGLPATDFSAFQNCYFGIRAYAALPDPYTASQTLTAASLSFLVALRIASLD